MDKHEKAFPLEDIKKYGQHGMDLRDWFAGQALMGLCANVGKEATGDDVAKSYRLADAMMKERDNDK